MYIQKFIFSDEELKYRDIEDVQIGTEIPKEKHNNSKLAGSSIRTDYNKYYQAIDDQSEIWDNAILACKHNPFALARILRANKAKYRGLDIDIYLLINYFGSTDIEVSEKLAQLAKVKTSLQIKSLDISAGKLSITKTDGTKISSTILSSGIPAFGSDDTLKSSQRMHKCHYRSIIIAKYLKKDAKVVTGMITGLTTKSKYVHTWVETTLNDEPVVIDYTMNAIINKDGYYALRSAEPITKIHHSDLVSDSSAIEPFIQSGDLTIKEYLVYRDQVLEAILALESE